MNINTVVANSDQAAGTGMIITSSGEVLTNNHVIDGATDISVELADGSNHRATVVGYDRTDDVALLQLQGVSGLPTITTAGASSLSVGDSIVAIGNALGRGGNGRERPRGAEDENARADHGVALSAARAASPGARSGTATTLGGSGWMRAIVYAST